MKQSRYANLLIDVVAQLASVSSPEENWTTVCNIARQLGASTINAGGISLSTRQPIWTRFGVPAPWMEEYSEAGLFQIDGLVASAVRGRMPRVVSGDRIVLGDAETESSRQFRAGLRRNGFNFFTCRGHVDGDVYKVLTLPTERDPRDLFGPGTERALDAVATLLLDSLGAPEGEPSNGMPWDRVQAPLFQPELDALSLMAHGFTLEEISARLKMEQWELHIHLQQGCRKLGVQTYDQALATALSRGLLSL